MVIVVILLWPVDTEDDEDGFRDMLVLFENMIDELVIAVVVVGIIGSLFEGGRIELEAEISELTIVDSDTFCGNV